MSLKFGLWLVEQGIATCDQFCGLIRIQQDQLPSPCSIAIQNNLISIADVNRIYQLLAGSGSEGFLEVARRSGLLTKVQTDLIRSMQLSRAPSIRSLAVEVGILTSTQAEVLYRHFLKSESRVKEEQAGTSNSIASENSPDNDEIAAASTHQRVPEPKFRNRPVIVHQYDVTY